MKEREREKECVWEKERVIKILWYRDRDRVRKIVWWDRERQTDRQTSTERKVEWVWQKERAR